MDAQRFLTTRAELEAFADPVRLLLVRVLVTREATLTQLSRYLGLKPNLVHYHLHKLLGLGLVRESRRDGAQHYYRATAMVIGVDPRFQYGEGADLGALPPESDDFRGESTRTVQAMLRLDDATLDDLAGELSALVARYEAKQAVEAPARFVTASILAPKD